MATPERYVIENMLRIVDKDSQSVPFILNSAQAALDNNLTGRDIVPKARQEGVSSYVLARWTILCMTRENIRAVVISHETDATQRMLAKVHYFLKNIAGPPPRLKNLSKNEITFPKTNSVFYIGTAGARAFGRGDTITHLHGSEVAYWPDPKKLLAGLLQAVPMSGEVVLESTGNGIGNYYHSACMRAQRGTGQYKLHFLPWHTFDEYTLNLTMEQELALLENLDPALEEPELLKNYGLTAGQLAWRRMKVEELDYDLGLFKQEYPMTLNECFQATGRSIFQFVNHVDIKEKWVREERDFWKHADHPKPGRMYSLGVDVSGGVQKDDSAIEVVDCETLEQVGEWVNDRIAPDVLAKKVDWLGRLFNNAYVTIESNNHGILTIKEVLGLYHRHLVHRGERTDTILDYGSRTTSQTKPLIIGHLRKQLAQLVKIHSVLLQDELATFVEKENGSLEAEDGSKDDLVIAMALAVYSSGKALMMRQMEAEHLANVNPDPFSLDYIIEEMNGRARGPADQFLEVYH